jgi:DNA-binding Xre family transcriptional regulator
VPPIFGSATRFHLRRYGVRMGDYGDLHNAEVAAELRAERARTRVTVREIVERTGISKSAVLNYLNGQRDIPVPALFEICAVLGVDAAEILDRAALRVKAGA